MNVKVTKNCRKSVDYRGKLLSFMLNILNFQNKIQKFECNIYSEPRSTTPIEHKKRRKTYLSKNSKTKLKM